MNKSKNTQLELNLCLEDENSGDENETINNSLPNTWKTLKLGDLCKTATGGTPSRKKPEYYGGNIAWVKSGELNDNLLVETEEKITSEGLKKSSAKLFPKNTLLVALYGATVGKTAILDIEAATNQAVCAIFPDNNKIDRDFLQYFIIYIRPNLLSQRYGGAQPNISQTIIRNIELAYPPIEEQRKIASVLTLIQEAIQEQENAIALTTELKKALMQKLFTEGINNEPQKMTEIGLIPESWEVVNLGKLAKLKSGGTPSRKKIKYWENGFIPWVKTTEINYDLITKTEEYITEEGLINSSAKMFPKGTLLMAMYGQGVTRGRVGILDIDATTNQACVAIMPNSDDKLSTKFLYHYFCYHYEKLRNQGHGANQSNLSSTILKMFPIAFPQIKEQLMIIDNLDILNLKLEQLYKKINILQNLFTTLLHQLMTAQIRVDELDLFALLPPNFAT